MNLYWSGSLEGHIKSFISGVGGCGAWPPLMGGGGGGGVKYVTIVVDVKCFRVIIQASKVFQIPLIILKCQ